MDIVYYRTTKGYAPAKAYIQARYGQFPNDSPKIIAVKIRTFAKVESVIEMAANSPDGRVGGTFSSTLTGYSFNEFRLKEGRELVRILYFPYQLQQIVLLDAYDKPENYTKAEKKKIEKEIAEIHDRAQEYYNDFIRNPKNHEPF